MSDGFFWIAPSPYSLRWHKDEPLPDPTNLSLGTSIFGYSDFGVETAVHDFDG